MLEILDKVSDLRNFGITVQMHWIPGHADFQGNIAADELTHDAWTLDESKWDEDFLSRDSFSSSHPWPQRHFPWDVFQTLTGPLRTMVCRLLTGKGMVRGVTHHFMDHSRTCRFCQLSKETTEHLLFDCRLSGSPLHDPNLDVVQKRLLILDPDTWIATYQWCLKAQVII